MTVFADKGCLTSTWNFYFRAKSFIEIHWWHYVDMIVLRWDASTFPSSLPRLVPAAAGMRNLKSADNISVFLIELRERDINNFYKDFLRSFSFLLHLTVQREFDLSPKTIYFFQIRSIVECWVIKNKNIK